MYPSVQFSLPSQAESLEGDEQGVAERFGVSIQAVRSRVKEIQLAIVCAAWFLEVTGGRELVNGRGCDFKLAIDISESDLFNEWNSSAFTFPEVIAMLGMLRNRL